MPHPFDRMHSVPDYEHLLAVLDDVDAIEVFNPRIAITEFNEEAVRFAAKYRIPAGAGSDAHVPQGLGSVRIRMRDFDGPAGVPASRCATPTSSATRRACCTSRRSSSCRRKRCPARPRRGLPGAARAPRHRPQVLMQSQGQARRAVQSDGSAGHRRRDPREVPRARDPRAQRVRAPAGRVPALPARAADAGARLRPSAGRHLHGQVLGAARRRSRRASRSTGAPATR